MSQPVIITPPAMEPVSLEEAQAHLRVEHDRDDLLITTLIGSARSWAEEYSGRALITQTLEIRLDQFACKEIRLPRPPIQSITSITYIDTSGALQTVPSAEYVLDADAPYPYVLPAWGKSWPSVRIQPGAVKIRYVAGYGPYPGNIPAHYRQAMLLHIGRYYEQRTDISGGGGITEVPFGAKALLAPSRITWR